VRFEWSHLQEKGQFLCTESLQSSPFLPKSYRSARGGNHILFDRLPASTNDFDVKCNLKFKYCFERAWAMVQLGFDNEMGIGGIVV
jgi:hypothetical protein